MAGLQITYRPQNLDEVFGNTAAITTMKKLLEREQKDMPRTFLFHGEAGCGKTTLARIFADELGCKPESFYEANASNTRGIDSIRDISEKCKLVPMFGDIQVYLLDECFHKDTLIKTVCGNTPIKDIKIGDKIVNIKGIGSVEKVFKTKIPLERVVKITLDDNKNIYCSKDHLFFTEKGWIKAKNLDKLNILCSLSEEMLITELEQEHTNHGKESEKTRQTKFKATHLSDMRKEILRKKRANLLFNKMQFKSKTIARLQNHVCSLWGKIYMQCPEWEILQNLFNNKLSLVWNKNGKKNDRKKVLQSILFSKTSEPKTRIPKISLFKGSDKKKDKIKIKNFIYNKTRSNCKRGNFKTDAGEQSIPQSRKYKKDVRNKKEKWNFRWMEKQSGWQWDRTYKTTDVIIKIIRQILGTRVYSENDLPFAFETASEVGTRKWLSPPLQNRHCKQKIDDSNRSGWLFPQMGRENKERPKERKIINQVRVESVEIYKRGSAEKSFDSVITDNEKNKGFIEFYDLQIDNHPSYKANGCIVHNCHQLTKDAMNAALKMLEDVPEHTFFILATTNPEKLIKPIRSRCTSIGVKPLNRKTTKELIEWVIEEEGEEDFPKEVIDAIVDASDGVPRDAVKLLDQVIDMEDIDEMVDTVFQDIPDESGLKDLCKLLMEKPQNKPWKTITDTVKGMSGNPEDIRRGVLNWLNKVLINGGDSRIAEIMECFETNYFDSGAPGLTLSCFQASLI